MCHTFQGRKSFLFKSVFTKFFLKYYCRILKCFDPAYPNGQIFKEYWKWRLILCFFLEGIQKISWSETFFNSFEYDEKMKGIELTWWIASSVIFYTRTQSIKEAESTSFLAMNYIYVVIENFSLFLSETNFQLFWFRKNSVEDSRNLRASTYTV